LLGHVPTGKTFHVYLDPERAMPKEAEDVHGLTDEFLKGKPKFASIASDFVGFIGDATLVIHNASFDMSFINWELNMAGFEVLTMDRVIDTLHMARRKFPMAGNSLDALCKRFGIDLSRRTKHGALLDSELLAEVYLELIGGRQTAMSLNTTAEIPASNDSRPKSNLTTRPSPLPSRLTEQERARHAALIAELGGKALWNRQI
jgi:DNA polymerase-3 subunit epsilon